MNGLIRWTGMHVLAARLIVVAMIGVASLGVGASVSTPIPAEEIAINDFIGEFGKSDLFPRIVTDDTGRIAILSVEGVVLRGLYSVDDGATFADVTIAGDAATPVTDFNVIRASDGTLLVVMQIGDDDGNETVRFTKSADMGQTFTAGVKLINGSTSNLQLAEGSDGFLAVSTGGLVSTSVDGGDNWSSAVPSGLSSRAQMVIQPEGNIIHLLNTSPNIAPTTVRSLDLGSSFEFAYEFPLESRFAAIAVASDGNVLVAFQEGAYPFDVSVVWRSVDQGQTYDESLRSPHNFTLEDNSRLATAARTSVVLLGQVDEVGGARVFRSVDHGHTFDDPQPLTSSAYMIRPEDLRFHRTPSGAWVAAWLDLRDAGEGNQVLGVYARSSVDSGATWGPERRLNPEMSVVTRFKAFDIATTDLNEIAVVYTDAQAEPNASVADVSLTRGSASTLAMAPGLSVDTDQGTAGPTTRFPPNTTTDGATRAYVAFVALDHPSDHHMMVSSTSDRGLTFTTPTRVSDAPVAFSSVPFRMAATPDGFVYVLYPSFKPAPLPSGQGEVRFAYSADYGQTWSETVLAAGRVEGGSLALAAAPGGKVYIAWKAPDPVELKFARSVNGGADLVHQTIDEASPYDVAIPDLCVGGDRVILAWRHERKPRVSISLDGGLTFGEPVDLSDEPSLRSLSIACTDAGQAVVTWLNSRELFTARYDGSTWEPAVQLHADVSDRDLDVVYTSPDRLQVFVAVETPSPSRAIQSFHSVDGGSTFSPLEPLDLLAEFPDGSSDDPSVAADGTGNVWVAWYEGTRQSIVLRRSVDGGGNLWAPISD